MQGRLREFLAFPWIRAALAGLGAAILCLLAAIAFWWPARTGLQELGAELETLAQRRTRLSAETTLARTVKDQETALVTVRQKLGQKASQNEVMGSLQALAEACGVRILEQKSVDTDRASRNVIRYMVSAEGDYKSLRWFIAEIPAKSPGLTAITSIRLGAGQSEGRLQAVLELSSYAGAGYSK